MGAGEAPSQRFSVMLLLFSASPLAPAPLRRVALLLSQRLSVKRPALLNTPAAAAATTTGSSFGFFQLRKKINPHVWGKRKSLHVSDSKALLQQGFHIRTVGVVSHSD